jgi:hypothetical protein
MGQPRIASTRDGLLNAPDMKFDERKLTRLAWITASITFYLPLLILRAVEPDDLLDSELVYNRAIGALWRGDASIAHAFLNGHVPLLSLSRLTQPLMLLYALLPPFPAYVLNDFIVRAVAAVGSYLLLRELHVPSIFRHLASGLFALSLSNTTYGLSIAGLPLATLLMCRSGRAALIGLLLIGWNSSLYLSGGFYLLVAPLLHKYIMERDLDRAFWRSLAAYAAGLLLGNAGLIVLELSPHPVWHRSEWGVFPPSVPFPYRPIARPLVPLWIAAILAGRVSPRVRMLAGFGAFVITWYILNQIPWLQLHRPAGVQIDRFYVLWPFALMLLLGLASRAVTDWGREILIGGILLGAIFSAAPFQQFRQIGRLATHHGGGYPAIEAYYHMAWFRAAHIDAPVVSVNVDPMAAPMNGVPSIDGYFPLYPLAYKHAFQRVYNDPLIASWGNKLYAEQGANFCAAKALGARYVVSAIPLNLEQVRGGELRLYRISC